MTYWLARIVRYVVVGACVLLATTDAAQATGFVYLAVPAGACPAPSSCAVPELWVIDADTAGIVIRLPLPAGSAPAGIAISPDGSHVYVSNSATQGSITVLDARRHVLIGTFPVGAGVAGRLAVRGDDSRVFIVVNTSSGFDFSTIKVFDTASRAIVGSTVEDTRVEAIAVSAKLDRVYALGEKGPTTDSPWAVRSFDAGTLVEVARATDAPDALPRPPSGMLFSPDEERLHIILLPAIVTFMRSATMSAWRILDPATLAIVHSTGIPSSAVPGAELERTRKLLLTGSFITRISLPGFPETGIAPLIFLPGGVRGLAVPPGEHRAYVTTTNASMLSVVDLDASKVISTTPLSQNVDHVIGSPKNVPTCSYLLDSGFSSFAVTGGMSTVRMTTGCAWQASSDQPWARLSTTSGMGTTTLNLTVDPQVLPTPRTATLTIGGQLVRVTQAGGVSQPPFGFVDTPLDGAGNISGALGVTGWALDDVGVAGVRIFRDPVAGESGLIFIGNATFVEGARPDVQNIFATSPFNSRAGWGLNVLTNMLPGGGNGMFRLHALADDVEGHTSLLGSKTISVNNAMAAMPFGAIDTPGQGEVVSGTIVNFGWALTPQPVAIPTDGSTIDVVIDGMVAGHPVYNQPRSDIQALFPGFANTSGPVGFFMIDTRTLANGIHTIAWVVRDAAGRAAGIGSRFFTVFN